MPPKSLFDFTYQELFFAIRYRLKNDIEGFIESFLCSQQWYRKYKGGRWELLCHDKKIMWNQEDNFVPIMEHFGQIVDVIKTEDWS